PVAAGEDAPGRRQRGGVDDERVVGGDAPRRGDFGKEVGGFSRVEVEGEGAAVKRLAGADDAGAGGEGEDLMAEANAQKRHAAKGSADERDGLGGVFGAL